MNPAASYAIGMRAALASGIEFSAPAELFLDTALGAAEKVAGQAIEALATEAVERLSGTITAAISDAMSGLLHDVPVAGEILSLALGGVLAGLHGMEVTDEERAKQQADCQQKFSARPPKASGSASAGCDTCPTDLFARNRKWKNYGYYRPMLGEALVCVTEGWEFDKVPEDVFLRAKEQGDSDKSAAAQREDWRRYGEARYHAIAKYLGDAVWQDRREGFRKVRMAIQEAHRPPGGGGLPPSDGGVALWPVYLEMCIREGFHEPRRKKYLEWQLGGLWLPKRGLYGNDHGNVIWRCHVPTLVPAVHDLCESWYRAINPAYAPAQQDLKELEAQRRALEAERQKRGSRERMRRRRLVLMRRQKSDATLWGAARRFLAKPEGKLLAALGGGLALAALAGRRR